MELEKFYRRINKKMIDSFINDKQEEHLTLEFKTVKTADLLDKQDKKKFAEALSGFANSSGGVIVWGIETKKIKGTDYATGTREIQPLSKFMPRLNQLTGDLVKPIVEGVLHGRIVCRQIIWTHP
jgi:predicted HTH transcriptional regulator